MTLVNSFGFDFQNFQLLRHDSVAFLLGGGLCIWDLATNTRDYIWSEKHGFSCFATNEKYGLIALAEYGLNPKIHVYEFPSKKLKTTISNICDLEIKFLNISRTGKKLLVYTGVPNNDIRVIDLERNEIMNGIQIPVLENFVFAQVNPFNNEEIVTVVGSKMTIYRIEASFASNPKANVDLEEAGDENANAPPLADAQSFLFNKEFKTIEMRVIENEYKDNFKQLVWNSKKDVYLIDVANRVIVYSLDDGGIIQQTQAQEDISAFILTQKYIIINQREKLVWLNKYDPEETDLKYLEYVREKTLQSDQIITAFYNHFLTKIIVANGLGEMYVLPLPADSNQEEEEDDEAKAEEKKKIKLAEFNKSAFQLIGASHTSKIVFASELKSPNSMITASQDGTVKVWDTSKKTSVFHGNYQADFCCGTVDKSLSLMALGSTKGCVRIFDISGGNPRLINFTRVSKKKTIKMMEFSPDSKYLMILPENSKKLNFLTLHDPSKIGLLCSFKMAAIFQYAIFCDYKKAPFNTQLPLIAALSSASLLLGFAAPNPDNIPENKVLEAEQSQTFARRIDADQNMLAFYPTNNEVFVSGKDKVLKRYRFPDELMAKLDPRIKAPSVPLEEVDNHELPTVHNFVSQDEKWYVSGSEDGSVFVRDPKKFEPVLHKIKAQNFFYQGVSALYVSKSNSPFAITCGVDKSIFIWNISSDKNAKIVLEGIKGDDRVASSLKGIEEVEAISDEEILHYKQIWAEELNRQRRDQREKIRSDLRSEVNQIKSKLQTLLKNNAVADELEKLERDEFVLDIAARDGIIAQGEKEKEIIREKARREIMEMEIFLSIIKTQTWDKMENHLKTLTGIKARFLVFNFHIRKRDESEIKKFHMILDLRKMEIKEKNILNTELKMKDLIPGRDVCNNPSNVIVNGQTGTQKLILMNYEKKEEDEEAMINTSTKKSDKPGLGGGAKSSMLKGGAGRLGGGHHAAAGKDEKKDEDENDENKKKIVKKNYFEEIKEWEFLYGIFDLFTKNRKISQIYVMKTLIFSIKKAFNKEFEDMIKRRSDTLDTIQGKNTRIAEILKELQKPVELFEPIKNPWEVPEEQIINVKPSEIPFERFRSKAERDKIAEAKRKEEERIRQLNADDAGIRAVKTMMGGTLEEKKDNTLNEKLEREEWMSKPQDEMSEEERAKFREFEAKEQKLNEEKEKIRKNLEQELKKLTLDINDLCNKFDDEVLILFRKRLEIEYRVCEQEIYIIRLTRSILLEQEAQSKEKETRKQIDELHKKLEDTNIQLQMLEREKKLLEKQRERSEKAFSGYNGPQRFANDRNRLNDLYNQFKSKRQASKFDDKWLEMEEFRDYLNNLDPYLEQDKDEFKKSWDATFDNFADEIKRLIQPLFHDELNANDKDIIINIIRKKFEAEKVMNKWDQLIQELDVFATTVQDDRERNDGQLVQETETLDEIMFLKEKSKSNIDCLFRFKQGFVEVSDDHDDPFPNISDALLVADQVIQQRNKTIIGKGQEKDKQLKDIKILNFNVEKIKHNEKILNLEIEDIKEKIQQIKRLKVKKELQIAIQGLKKQKENKEKAKLKKNDAEKKDPIDRLVQATNARLETIQNKEERIRKEIEFLKAENETLQNQGRNLTIMVKQREEIALMMDNRTKEEGETSAQNKALEKFSEISTNRKLFDLAKRQAEEIELLRAELNRLKSKTFANFSNVTK